MLSQNFSYIDCILYIHIYIYIPITLPHLPETLICRGVPSFSSVIPCTSRKTTKSPSWKPCRLSWCVWTVPGFSQVIPETMALRGSSPSLSRQVKASPKSTKTEAAKPKQFAAIKPTLPLRQSLFNLIISDWLLSVSTINEKLRINSSVMGPLWTSTAT